MDDVECAGCEQKENIVEGVLIPERKVDASIHDNQAKNETHVEEDDVLFGAGSLDIGGGTFPESDRRVKPVVITEVEEVGLGFVGLKFDAEGMGGKGECLL